MSKNGRVISAVLLVVVALGWGECDRPRATEAEWYVDYDHALRAIDGSMWREALDSLERAETKNPKPALRARTYGMRFRPYFPDYYRGVAYYGMGDVKQARAAFMEEWSAGVVQKDDRLNRQLEVFLLATDGSTSDSASIRIVDERLKKDAERLQLESQTLLESGDIDRAMAALAAVPYMTPDNQSSAEAMEKLQEVLVREELKRTTSPTRSQPESLESRAWEILHEARALLISGDFERALVRFDTALLLAQELGALKTLEQEAGKGRECAETEIRGRTERLRQMELAASTSAPPDPPKIAIVTPVSFDEPVKSEIVRLQGTVMDGKGIRELQIEVNGRECPGVRTGTRGVKIVALPGVEQSHSADYGTIVNFYRDIRLDKPSNRVVVRARNIANQTTEEVRDITLDMRRPELLVVVIGIGEYENHSIPSLEYAVADADAFYDYAIRDLGVPPANVYRLTNEEATTPAMKTLLGTELRRRASPDDTVIIYFAGHGAPETDAANRDGDGLEKYLLSVEADPTNLYGTAFSMNEVATVFGRLHAGRVLFIADACYSGASGGRTLPSGHRAAISDNFLDRLAGGGRGRIILSASSANEPSLERDDLGHGVFTYFLLQGLKGAADLDHDELVTVDEAYSYVFASVAEMTGQSQHPVRKGEVEGEWILGRVLND